MLVRPNAPLDYPVLVKIPRGSSSVSLNFGTICIITVCPDIQYCTACAHRTGWHIPIFKIECRYYDEVIWEI